MQLAISPETQMMTAPLAATNAFAAEDEQTLVAQAKNGSTVAFERLIERYERRVFRLAQNITRNHEDTEDVVQNAFVQAFRNLSRFRGDSRFYTWLVRITVNQALMKIRQRRWNEVSIDDSIETEGSVIPHQLEDWGPNPEERYSQEELREILAATIGELDPGYRVVFQLRDIEGLSTEETAQTLDLSLPAVKTRLRRVRLQLRDSLDKYFRPTAGARIDSLRPARVGRSHYLDC